MMDQVTSHQSFDRIEPARAGRTVLIAGLVFLPVVAIGGLLIGTYLGRTPWPILSSFRISAPSHSAAGPNSSADTPVVLYYQNPDGKPVYSPQPRRTADGRSFRPVRVGEDVSFDGEPNGTQVAAASAGATAKKILYYRNPMGLPDISSIPKKDSMGMDYIPVYAGEAEDSSTITISPG